MAISIDEANRIGLERILAARPVLEDLVPAAEALGLAKATLLHAGPPVEWPAMAGPVRGAVAGALVYEGLAPDLKAGAELAASGDIRFAPCHHHRAVGPMAGIVSASMPVFVVSNRVHGNRAHSTMNEGLGKVLRYGANDASVIERLRWMAEVAAPLLGEAIRRSGGLDLGAMLGQAVQMGDEGHNRNRAGTSLFIRALAPHLIRTGARPDEAARVLEFIATNDHSFLNLSMAACKATMDAAHGIPGCSIVTAMARNGTEVGIRVSGLGERWFTAPAPVPEGLYFQGYGPADANPDLGDSAITETAGLGAFAMAAAPAIVQFIGGKPADALRSTQEMYEITLAENPAFRIPALDFRGSPTAIDIRKVVETGILPLINTGIAHRRAGIGQIGAGLVRMPMDCFTAALEALAQDLGSR